MTLREALRETRHSLAEGGFTESDLEGELLVRHTLGLSREQMYLAVEQELTPAEETVLEQLTGRRLRGEPVAYIIGKREFYGKDFFVDPRVLIPRPESELLVEKALERAKVHPLATIADVGTGSGALAITLAIHLPPAKIYAIDISPEALQVAWCNALSYNLGLRLRLLTGHLLEPLPGPVDLMVANLPYVPEKEIPPDSCEPRTALDGGPDGLAVIRRFLPQVPGKLCPGGTLLMEVGQGQAAEVACLLHGLFPPARQEVYKDLAGIERVVSLTLPE